MGHRVRLGVVEVTACEISRDDLVGVSRRGEIERALPLFDDRVLLREPGAKVGLFVCVELLLGHLVPPSGSLWCDELRKRGGCDPFVSEHRDVGRDGSPEDDGTCQCSGFVEKGLVELDKLALEAACALGSLVWWILDPLFAFLGLYWRWGDVAALDCTFELELGFALFSRERRHKMTKYSQPFNRAF